ncbi:RpiR family transcriptional regulator [Rhizobium sp. Root149]|uniref:DNA-binding MurR/RpiR family transcriptional regulator n=1 Tax=Rhizobium rhizoryzae TaxID=451876 RepID=A0A7W6LF06_9HYPH|nr:MULTISPECIES: MurR/RpiR family transcriptional regulator [Rhizobium]KQZ54665.1 RpiR family transcriptional regulator [Rhizobium sp. Root149]MBB4141746.1 DNA-binding MurR/RpiR family transcriptional regulator [Rhizobium rhizoryzae]
MTSPSHTVLEVIRQRYDGLTPAEKRLADSLLENYPVSGLGSITATADNAGVSTPTVARMVQKLGYKGYPEFQAHLHVELEATISNPITKHDRWASGAPTAHILNRFAEAITDNLRETLSTMDVATFDAAAALLRDDKRSVYFVGGRITGALAEYFFTHMQVIRPRATLISTNRSSWPQYLLNMSEGDVIVIFDIRRYEQELATLAETAAANGVVIILFTDVWASPVARHAQHVFKVRIEAPSAWDSSVVTLFTVEALIEAVQSATWEKTRERMNSLETLFERSRLFRRTAPSRER